MTEQTDPPNEVAALLKSPIIRVAIVILVLMLVLGGGVFVAVNAMLSARSQPIDVVVYSNAQLEAREFLGPGQDRLFYTSHDDAQSIADFYIQHYDISEDQRCVTIENELGNNAEQPPFEVICTIDRSVVNAQQTATIIIQPQPTGRFAGQTVIDIRRTWQE